MEIYLDNSATTMVRPEVAKLMYEIMTKDYGNPSSMHIRVCRLNVIFARPRRFLQGSLRLVRKRFSLRQAEPKATIWQL